MHQLGYSSSIDRFGSAKPNSAQRNVQTSLTGIAKGPTASSSKPGVSTIKAEDLGPSSHVLQPASTGQRQASSCLGLPSLASMYESQSVSGKYISAPSKQEQPNLSELRVKEEVKMEAKTQGSRSPPNRLAIKREFIKPVSEADSLLSGVPEESFLSRFGGPVPKVERQTDKPAPPKVIHLDQYTLENGAIFSGTFFNHNPFGFGRKVYADGSVYEGSWLCGLKHGHGVKTYTNGDKYEGNWFLGYPHGYGCKYYHDNETYLGEWCRGMRHGLGKQKYKNCSVYVGTWDNDLKHGSGFVFHKKKKYQVDYLRDVLKQAPEVNYRRETNPLNPSSAGEGLHLGESSQQSNRQSD